MSLREPSTSILSGGSGQTFHELKVNSAGRDCITLNVSLNNNPPTFAESTSVLDTVPADPIPQKAQIRSKSSFWAKLSRRLATLNTITEPRRRALKRRRSVESEDEPEWHVSSVDETDTSVVIPTRARTSAQTYIRNMIAVGEGFPCWNPTASIPSLPRCGIVPGDVGIICPRDGFIRLFNLWDKHDSTQGQWTAPQAEYLPDSRPFAQGHTFAIGAAADVTIHRGSHIFEFHCHSSEGGILAITSDTDLHSFTNRVTSTLRHFISLNASKIYRYALAKGGITDKQPLCIITGCIKAHSWAMAAYREKMVHPRDILRLVPRDGGTEKVYMWTQRGTSDPRCSDASGDGPRDQCLFIRGFTLSPSDRFWETSSNGVSSQTTDEAQGGSSGGTGTSQPKDRENRDTGHRQGGDTNGKMPESRNAFSSPPSSSSRLSVEPFPYSTNVEIYHPSHYINELLKEKTGCEFALAHDDDWMGILKGRRLCSGEDFSNFTEEIDLLDVTIDNGVAFVTSTKVQNPIEGTPSVYETRRLLLDSGDNPGQILKICKCCDISYQQLPREITDRLGVTVAGGHNICTALKEIVTQTGNPVLKEGALSLFCVIVGLGSEDMKEVQRGDLTNIIYDAFNLTRAIYRLTDCNESEELSVEVKGSFEELAVFIRSIQAYFNRLERLSPLGRLMNRNNMEDQYISEWRAKFEKICGVFEHFPYGTTDTSLPQLLAGLKEADIGRDETTLQKGNPQTYRSSRQDYSEESPKRFYGTWARVLDNSTEGRPSYPYISQGSLVATENSTSGTSQREGVRQTLRKGKGQVGRLALPSESGNRMSKWKEHPKVRRRRLQTGEGTG
ncbi:hypothetical protein D9611_011355 [Ephemerocybe angulata]|uniref:Uncharacterized protein n=1 Tax=Ephemerocybe angulata TaxID=980116 RepID=A0A8H5F1N0_9AGAR|nr:hypothetical protein D9611_011355 [Tulosesus angulatus]